MTVLPDRARDDRGFTLVEVVIAIVLVGILSAVVVVGVGNLTTRGTTAACTTSADAARAAATTHLGTTGTYPTTLTAMTASSPPALILPDGATIDGTGRIATVGSWALTLVPGTNGQPPRFACNLPTGFTVGPNGNYYRHIRGATPWAAASAAAATFSANGKTGHLATIDSETENAFVTALIEGHTTWLGGSDAGVENEWRWAGGPDAGLQFSSGATPIGGRFTNWNSGEPNSASEDCLQIIGSGRWSDGDCAAPWWYLVEIPS